MVVKVNIKDQSQGYEVVEWVVWHHPYQRLVATWEEL